MRKIFKNIKIFLIALLVVVILNDIGAYLYIVIVGHDASDFPYVTAEVLVFIFAAYLIFKNVMFGDMISAILAAWSLQTALKLDHALFSCDLLNFGPQVVFSNALMIAILTVSIIHFILLIMYKMKNSTIANSK